MFPDIANKNLQRIKTYKIMNMQTTIEVDEIEVNVSFDFKVILGDPGLYAYSNGDPGYPPTSDEIDVLSAVTDSEGNEYEPTYKEWDRIYEECHEYHDDLMAEKRGY